MKKHRNTKERVDPGNHRAIWSRLVCSMCRKVSSFGDEEFITTHTNCTAQVSTAKRSFVVWLDELSATARPMTPEQELRSDLRLSSDEEEDNDDLVFPHLPKAKFQKKEKPTTSVTQKEKPTTSVTPNPSHEVDIDLEGVFGPEECNMDWMDESETEKAISSILPPTPAITSMSPPPPPPIPAVSLPPPPPIPAVSLPPTTPATSLLPSTPATPLLPPSSPTPADPLQPPPTPTPTPASSTPERAPPTPKPRQRKGLGGTSVQVAKKGIARQVALHNKDHYMARVTQREAQIALLDRYEASKSTIKRLTTEKEEAELKAAAIHTIKEENTRLRKQRGDDLDAISKLEADKAQLKSRLDFLLNTNRDLGEKLRKVNEENEQLKRACEHHNSRHTLHIPCVCGVVVMRPEVHEDGSPLAICYESQENGVFCHHIALNRVDGHLTATALQVQKRRIPDDVIESARRMSR